MDYDKAIEKAIEEAGDEYAVIGCKNVGNAAAPIFIYSLDDPEGSGTQWQGETCCR